MTKPANGPVSKVNFRGLLRTNEVTLLGGSGWSEVEGSAVGSGVKGSGEGAKLSVGEKEEGGDVGERLSVGKDEEGEIVGERL